MKSLFSNIKPIVLIILDGWGVAPPSKGNILSVAEIPVMNNLVKTYPAMVLRASGEAVGLSEDQPGNSGAGHLTLGVGRVIPYQKQYKYSLTNIPQCLSQIISQAKLAQIHIAETEKYNQATFYFNGKTSQPFSGEEWVLIPSPQTSNYSDFPAMSAFEITSRAIKEIKKKKYHFMLINYCNPEIIGKTGNFEATKKAVEIVDQCLEKLLPEILELDGIALITADHGNVEEYLDLKNDKIISENTSNPVPFIIVGKEWEGKAAPKGDTIGADLSLLKPAGTLADVAPTILKLLGLKQPKEMTGKPLI